MRTAARMHPMQAMITTQTRIPIVTFFIPEDVAGKKGEGEEKEGEEKKKEKEGGKEKKRKKKKKSVYRLQNQACTFCNAPL